MTQETLKVTIIISTFNCVDKISTTLESIGRLNKKESIEVIVVDGCSSDGTLKIVHQFQDVVSQVISESDDGIYDAWNKGVRLAHGEWIVFIGAGDEVSSEWVDLLCALRKKYHLVYADLKIKSSDDGSIHILNSKPWHEAKKKFLYKMTIPHVGTAHHFSLFEKGKFDSNCKIVGDWEFLSRGVVKNVYYAPGVIQAVMEMGEGISNNAESVGLQYREILRVFSARKMSMPFRYKLIWYFKKTITLTPYIYSVLQKLHWKIKCLKS